MPLKNVLGTPLAFLAKHLGLRHRYVFTKNNRLRLRYVASLTAVCAAVLPTMIAFSSGGQLGGHLQLASAAQAHNMIETAAGSNDGTQKVASVDPALLLASVPQFEEPLLPSERVVTMGEGDVLGKVIQDEGVPGEDVHQIIAAMKKHFDPRHIKAGQNIHMNLEPNDGSNGYHLASLKIELNPLKTVEVLRDGQEYESKLEEKEVKQVVQAQKAVIKNSLYGSAAKAGIPKSIVSETIKIYSQNIDFQRDVKAGDVLEVMYETHETDDGYVAKTGNVLFAQLTVAGRKIPLYRYKTADGNVDYFGPDGKSTKKTLMKTPIDGARMSSGYGMRRHPVLGYSKMHKGIDFAAPTGTPIYAAGDGRIEKAGRFSSYGNYVRIRHRSGLDTAYGHLSRFAKGIKPGVRIKQGQIIGYVGSTGRSTGPHLHYEILVNSKQVNPRGLNLPIGHALAGADLKRFKSHVQGVNNQFASKLTGGVKLAQRQVQKSQDIN